MQCKQVLEDEIAEGYLRGALSAADQEAFEQHYFGCASCFGELENLDRGLVAVSTSEGI